MPRVTGAAASGTSACLGSLRIQLALPCRSHERCQALGFLRRGSSSRSCQREVLASRIHVGRAVNRDNESFVRETAQYLVQGTGRGIEASARLLLDVLSDRVSVRRPVAEREEDVEHQVGQGRSQGRFPSRVDWTAFPVGRLADGKL